MSDPVSLDLDSPPATVASTRAHIVDGPVVIQVRDLEKSFQIPEQRGTSVRERTLHPFSGGGYRELHALKGISFEVHQGEFFGIVGRNGSGKSTLLKILSSIYRADAGTIRMAGRLAPFIELGVGFNTDLTARENVALNGVMMGLGRREAAMRLDAVLDFAELRDYVDLKLKNYSSGMMVRLAFAAMVEADADIMLVDEVLAVGDASFAQKCMDVFREKRRVGKTLVLVTHDMAAVQGFCDRAMLIHDGHIRYLGDPEETALRYFRLNFGGAGALAGTADAAASIVDVWLEDAGGRRIEDVPQGAPFQFKVVVEAREELNRPAFGFQVLNRDGVPVFGFGKMWEDDEDGPERVAPGRRVRIGVRVDNRLVPDRYHLSCTVSRDRTQGDLALKVPNLLEFEVLPRNTTRVAIEDYEVGMVSVQNDIEATLEHDSL
jgi:ABC-type polysaccharide/polyol phosphate transport system ATPase subunit